MEIIFLIGRIILGAYFIYNAYNHFMNVEHLAGYAASKKVPHANIAVMGTGLMLAVGGVSVLTGVGLVVGAWILVAFLLGVSFMMHAYWKISDAMNIRMAEKINFMKNMALVGALLMIISMRM